MDTPRLVLDAFLVEPVRAAGIDLQPLTIRRWMKLEAAGNPLLDFDVPEEMSARLDAVMGAVGILSDGHATGRRLSGAGRVGVPPAVAGILPETHWHAAGRRVSGGQDAHPTPDFPPPEEFDDLAEAVLQVIGQGFSTALQMDFPGDTGEALPADLVDLFGLPARLLAHAVKRLCMAPDAALDMPTCQLFVLIAATEALDGKIPKGKNYRDREK